MSANRKVSGSRLHPDLIAMIERYVVDKGWTNAAQLHRELRAELEGRPLRAEVPDDPRSIRTWVRRFQAQDASGTWTLSNAAETDPVAVAAVLGAMLADEGEPAITLTNGEARIITALYRIDAAIAPLEALRLARRYQNFEERDQPTAGLDRYAALRGWRLPPEQYEELRRRGLFEGVGRVDAQGSPEGRGVTQIVTRLDNSTPHEATQGDSTYSP